MKVAIAFGILAVILAIFGWRNYGFRFTKAPLEGEGESLAASRRSIVVPEWDRPRTSSMSPRDDPFHAWESVG